MRRFSSINDCRKKINLFQKRTLKSSQNVSDIFVGRRYSLRPKKISVFYPRLKINICYRKQGDMIYWLAVSLKIRANPKAFSETTTAFEPARSRRSCRWRKSHPNRSTKSHCQYPNPSVNHRQFPPEEAENGRNHLLSNAIAGLSSTGTKSLQAVYW